MQILSRGWKFRIGLVATLFLLPIVFLCGAGLYHLWMSGWAFVAWWPMALCFFSSYLLAWHWTRRRKREMELAGDTPSSVPHWTERDKEAWKLVEKYAENLPIIQTNELSNLHRYADDAQKLAMEVTKLYQPNAADPFGHLTLPEILACAELIAHDLAQLVDKYVPGSHALKVNHFRAVRTATDWYERGRNVYWAVSMLIDPLKAGMQILATKAGLQSTFNEVQKNVLNWFYIAYLQQLGRYIIELNSGRLKIGAKRYRELIEMQQAPPTVVTAEEPPKNDLSRITVALVGPVKAGKSSMVNALLGEQRAAVAATPLTATTTKYELNQEGLPPFRLLDTAGFAYEGAKDTDILAALEAASQADVLLLVVPARSAARAPEVDFLKRLRDAFMKRPELRIPPTLVVLTHIDLLSPAMEWQPPYDWKQGTRPKEVSIREAVAAAREVFNAQAVELIPVCAALGKEHGVRDELLGVLTGMLDEARGVGLLRALHAETGVDKTMKVITQAANAGRELLRAFLRLKTGA